MTACLHVGDALPISYPTFGRRILPPVPVPDGKAVDYLG